MVLDRLITSHDSETARGWNLVRSVIMFLATGGFAIWFLLGGGRGEAELLKTGAVVEGRVYKIGRDSKRRPLITYGYAVDGKSYNKKNRRVDRLDGLEKLGPINIHYDPADPDRCVTANEIPLGGSWKGGILGVTICGLLAVLAAFRIVRLLVGNRGAMLGD